MTDFQRQDGYTSLILAAYKGRVKIVQMLLDAGANMEARSNVCKSIKCLTKLICKYFFIYQEGWTPLIRAATYNKVEIVKILVERGVNMEGKDKALIILE